jgi:hypothetical protein
MVYLIAKIVETKFFYFRTRYQTQAYIHILSFYNILYIQTIFNLRFPCRDHTLSLINQLKVCGFLFTVLIGLPF